MFGSRGRAEVSERRLAIENGETWKFDEQVKNMYQVEHDRLFASIRSGSPINNGEYMCNSTLMALMGRMSAYSGQEITWEQAWNSQEILMPDNVTLDMAPPKFDVAMPGKTKFG